MAATIRTGTASWSDPGFVADWYPKGIPAGERLRWYAERFNLVEVNSSFYSIPNHRLVQRWCDQTPSGFVFDVKLHRLLSRHSTKPELLPPDLRERAVVKGQKVELTPELEQAVAKRFRQEIEPFAQAGKLGALLLQLSPSFSPRTHQLAELEPLFDCFRGCTLAVELRQRDWVTGEQLQHTADFFREHNLTFVDVDAPQRRHFMIMPSLDLVTNPRLAYLRCHGRNAEGFIRGRSVAERFDYLYNDQELHELAERAMRLAEQASTVHVIYNNNTSNYAPANVAQFHDLLASEHPEVSTGPASAEPQYQPMELDLGQTPRRPGARRLQHAKP